MKNKDMSFEELEVISYDDLAFKILKEKNKNIKITDLFKEICDLKKLSASTYENKIGDFFELLTTDKRFFMLDDGSWDLKEKHTNKIKITNEDDDEDEEISDINEDMDEEIIEEDNIFYEQDETDDEAEDDLKDLVIIDDEDEANSL